jgi:LacI family transcriptional regulator
MAASMKDVATKAGVSTATVSNALNHPELVSAATAVRIHQAIEELGFVRNGSAINLRAGKSRSIGLVVPDIGNPFFTDIARGAEDLVGARQYAMVLCNTDEDQEKQERYLRLLIQQGVDGLLIRPNDEDEEPLLALRERGLSVVLINRQTENRNFCSVVVDGERGSEESVDYLAGLGHKHIAWATWSLKNPGFATRAKGIAKAAKRWGMDVSTITVQGMNNGSGEIAAEKFLTLEPRPTAILCANDLLALDALRGLIQRGIRVPEDVSVIGFDDIDFCANARVPLTTVAVPRYQIGSTAAGLLLDEIDNPEKHAHQQVVFQPRLIIRESTGPAPSAARPAPPE